jgi:hypothetical protein
MVPREMPRFWLSIRGEDLGRAVRLLDDARIKFTAGSEGYFGSQPPPDLPPVDLTAMVDAKSGEDAEARVTRVLPKGYTVERQKYVVKKKWPDRGRTGYHAGASQDLRDAIEHAELLDKERDSDDYNVDVDMYDAERRELVPVWSSAWPEEKRAEVKRLASGRA